MGLYSVIKKAETLYDSFRKLRLHCGCRENTRGCVGERETRSFHNEYVSIYSEEPFWDRSFKIRFVQKKESL